MTKHFSAREAKDPLREDVSHDLVGATAESISRSAEEHRIPRVCAPRPGVCREAWTEQFGGDIR
jgi:hypothetical protein